MTSWLTAVRGRSALVPFVILASALLAAAQGVKVRAAVFLVDSELNVRPVPRHALVVRLEGSVDVGRMVTTLDGKAEIELSPGRYVLESEKAVDFQGRSYRWRMPFVVATSALSLELSTDNALTGTAAPIASGGSLPVLFREWQESVVTVWSDTGHGSGFVVDPRGLVVTNQHVVSLSEYAAVQFSPTVKVPAQIVSRSADKDVAVLRVNPEAVKGITPVRLATRSDRAPQEGEPVFTIGSPLNQRKVMTTGIVSKVETRAIISDVNINHGNSGGPLFMLDGRVVGITTFGDFTTQGGPGISGIVRIEEALESIAAAATLSTPPPAGTPLPVEPAEAFPVDQLKATLQTRPVRTSDYQFGASDFDVSFITPVLTYGVSYAAEQAALREKAKRSSGGATTTASIDPLAGYKNWGEYVGQYRAVLMVDARPKLVEGFWSGFSRGLAQSQGLYGGPASLHFKADFRRMVLWCGDRLIEPIHPGKVEHRAAVSNAAVRVNDITFEGLYIYSFDAISPACGKVTLELYSEKNPDRPEVKIISPKIVQRVWDDFSPLRSKRQ